MCIRDSTHTHAHTHMLITISIDPNDITTPPQQYTFVGHDYTLQCSSDIADSFISWLRDGQLLSSGTLTISSVQLSNEGVFKCRVSILGASFEKPVQLNIVGEDLCTKQAVEFTTLIATVSKLIARFELIQCL